MITDVGYMTRCHLLLNIQCVRCGVWVAMEGNHFIEFDGMFHSCAGEPYGKQAVGQNGELALEIQE